jgi:hypothetical protein
MSRKPLARATISSPRLSDDPSLGELLDAEARGEPIPEHIQAALAPLTRLFQDIRRTLRLGDKRPGPHAVCIDIAAGPRALALALAPFPPVAVPPPKNAPPKSAVRHDKVFWRKRRQDVANLKAGGKRAGEAEREVARAYKLNPKTLHARIHSRKLRRR